MPKKTVEVIVETGNHYLLQVKANQVKLLEEIANEFEQHQGESCIKTERNKGRDETRVCEILLYSHTNWTNLATIIKITTTVKEILKDKQKRAYCNQYETVKYFISDLTKNPEFFLKLKRKHWSIEAFHYIKDVTFKEDSTRSKTPSINALLNSLIYNQTQSKNRALLLRKLANNPLLAYQYINK